MCWDVKWKPENSPIAVNLASITREGETVGFYLRNPETIAAIRSKDPRIFDILSIALEEIEEISAVMDLHDGMYFNYWADNPEIGIAKANLILNSKYADEADRASVRKILEIIEQDKRKKIEAQAKRHYSKKRRSQFSGKRSDLMLALIERDGYQCKNCGSQEDLGIDHVIPLSKGGSDDLENLQILCQSCNSSKGDGYE